MAIAAVLSIIVAPTVHAADTPAFADLFKGGAVLQRGATVSVWGTGTGTVKLYLDGTLAAQATSDGGNWSASIPPQTTAVGRVLSARNSAGKTDVTVSFGDVILCSGQSNMDMPLYNRAGAFQADNGTAEVTASSRYTGDLAAKTPGIWVWRQVQSKYRNPTAWKAASPEGLNYSSSTFSAVCWYTGKNYFDRLGGKVPVGMLQASVGGSPIEFWLSATAIAKCETDKPQCDTTLPDSAFYDDQIVSLQPYTVGAIVWDQAERDLKCDHVEHYPCMMAELVRSWRESFKSASAAFVGVQLPDYYDPKDPGNPGVPGFENSAEGVFSMRLAQEAALNGVDKAAFVATYDQSCNNLAYPADCPWGSVHNVHKVHVGERVAAQLSHLIQGADIVVEGPRAQSATTEPVSNDSGYSVTVSFKGGSTPFAMQATRNCTDCCKGSFGASAKGDFDASHDGETWAAGTNARLEGSDKVVFHVDMKTAPAFIRYTAGSNFTQCALFNAEGLPALPFRMNVTKSA